MYGRDRYDTEKRQALEVWAHRLDQIVTGVSAKVVRMRSWQR